MGNPQEAGFASPPSYVSSTPLQPTQVNNPNPAFNVNPQQQFTPQPLLAQDTPGINAQPQQFQNNNMSQMGQVPTAPASVFQPNNNGVMGGVPQQGYPNQQFQQQPMFNQQQQPMFNQQQQQGFNPQQPQYPIAAQQTGQQQFAQMPNGAVNPPQFVGQPILQATSPLQILGPGPGPVECPSCGQRGITRVEYKVGSTTHLWAAVACAFICMPCIPYLINETKDVSHSCTNCGVLLATHMRSGGTLVHCFGRMQ